MSSKVWDYIVLTVVVIGAINVSDEYDYVHDLQGTSN